ncbi:MAG: type 1 glutamine amidotransferase domain-containing protein [Candidatus Korobacteraceae bacterium]
MSDRLAGFRVAILATDLFQEDELIKPRKALEEAGATTVVIAPHGGEIKAAQHEKATKNVQVDQTLAEADPEKFDALLLPGGRGNAEALRTEPLAQEFVRRISETRRPIAAICHGGLLLIAAHLVKGRHLTSYNAVKDEFTSAGAYWYDKEVVRDGNLVSSRQPSDIPAFNQEMLNLFIDHHLQSHAAA